jgi:sec-independent protein translocase protein TatA
MLANLAGMDLGIVLVIILVVVFGGSQLPKIARNVGSAGKEFRKAQQEAEEEDQRKAAEAKAVVAAPVAPTVTAPVAAPADDDKVTLSKADLEALLDERLKKNQSA